MDRFLSTTFSVGDPRILKDPVPFLVAVCGLLKPKSLLALLVPEGVLFVAFFYHFHRDQSPPQRC